MFKSEMEWMMSMKKQLGMQQITEGVIWKQLLIFFFPIMLGTFFQQMYNTVDTIIVGRFVGTQALAAVGSTAAIINLINSFFLGLSTGATVVISQFYGAGDRKNTHDTIQTAMTLSVILGVIIMVMGLSVGPWVLRAIKTPEHCMQDSLRYITVYFFGPVAAMVYNMGAGILRAMGDSKRPTFFLIAACLVNIVLDLLFVVVFHLGVVGAALATILSQLVSAVLVVIVLMRLPENLAFSLKEFRMDRFLLSRILAIGVPSGLQMITYDLANLLVQSGVNSFGEVTIAAWAAYSKTDAMIWMIIGAFGVAVTTFVGQNYGAKKYDRIKRSVWVCHGMSFVLIGALSVLLLYFREPILGIYTSDIDVIRVGSSAMMIIAPFYVLYLPVEIMAGAMRGCGYSIVPTVITSVCVCLCRALWVMFVLPFWHTIEVLSATYPITWFLACVVFLIVYFRGNWLYRNVKLEEPEIGFDK